VRRVNIAISMGDPSGIGPEVLVKALKYFGRARDAAFFIFGNAFVLKYYGLANISSVKVIDMKNINTVSFKPGSPTKNSAKASIDYLNEAVSFIKSGSADCLVTAPISKENVSALGFSWPGHTEFLADAFGRRFVEMVFVSERLKVILLTRHIALKDVAKVISKKRIKECASLALELLRDNFKIRHPKIAVCGLNPHAGEAGLFGSEEKVVIAPAIKELNIRWGSHFYGPYAADTVFKKAYEGGFDMVVAMYHDQGLIPFKLMEFQEGVHLTAGLGFIRTSPVHGTAFDIAGKNIADHRPMASAMRLAYTLTKNTF